MNEYTLSASRVVLIIRIFNNFKKVDYKKLPKTIKVV